MLSKFRSFCWSGGTKRKFATVLSVLVLGAGGVALAAWLINGTGEGAAKIGTLTPPTVTPGTATGGCLPGGACDGAFLITNPNSVPLVVTGTVTSVTGGESGSSTDSVGCPYSNLGRASVTGLSINVPANSTNTPVTVPGAFTLAASAPSACQGQTLTRKAQLTFSTP